MSRTENFQSCIEAAGWSIHSWQSMRIPSGLDWCLASKKLAQDHGRARLARRRVASAVESRSAPTDRPLPSQRPGSRRLPTPPPPPGSAHRGPIDPLGTRTIQSHRGKHIWV